jgi:hypothetical protein
VTSPLGDAVRHPKIYVWTDEYHATVPWEGSRSGVGLVKVGYTGRDVRDRIRESRGVKSPVTKPYELLLSESAVRDDGKAFLDHSVHQRLVAAGARQVPDEKGRPTEWFEATVDEVAAVIAALKSGSASESLRVRHSFSMRDEQRKAVEQTAAYFEAHADGDRAPHFLWNAKMRFGKTFATYQLARRMGWIRILVLTYKPAVEDAWREDLLGHVEFEGWRFKGKDDTVDLDDSGPLVWFASFQDVLGTDEDGNPKIKNEDLYLDTWDAVVIDEYHFGAWREAARSLYVKDPEEPSLVGDDSEKRELDTPDVEDDFQAEVLEDALTLEVRHFLYLSGTPFRALTQGEFLEDQIFNWTYADEQRAKQAWDAATSENPYAALPTMHLLAYEMPEALRQVALDRNLHFSLTEFFRTERDDAGVPRFLHEQEVQKWLDLLRGQDLTGLWSNVASHARPPLPYEDMNLLRALQHTIWYLPGVDACYAMRDLLQADHNTFYRDYNVVVAAGTKAGIGVKALPPVQQAIGGIPQDTKTITLTAGKLLTGVTVPGWAGILMLRELKSPESYFQAAFRIQSPWTSTVVDPVEGGQQQIIHKQDCFVIDFAPNRALSLIVDYATRLGADLASERNDEAAVEEFLEFLPVLSFDGYGMAKLRAADVIDHLSRGITSTMLARRWNSPELVSLTTSAMGTLLSNPELLASLEQIETFRNITQDLTAMISSNKEIQNKRIANEKPSKEENERKKEAGKRRDDLKKRIQRFITRIPAFMYLTDDREKTIKDIIEQFETEMFEQVTGLTLDQFRQLVDAGVFDDSKMNEAVWKFKEFEDPSLTYVPALARPVETRGGWNLTRDERLAQLITSEVLRPGDELTGPDGEAATVTDNYGIAVAGIRYATPDEAAAAVGGSNGWHFWSATSDYGIGSLEELAGLVTPPARSLTS